MRASGWGASQDPLSLTYVRKVGYSDRVEKAKPGYVHKLWHHGQRILGGLVTFSELAQTIKAKSAVPGETRAML